MPQTNANRINNQVQVEEIISYTMISNRTKPTMSVVVKIDRLFYVQNTGWINIIRWYKNNNWE